MEYEIDPDEPVSLAVVHVVSTVVGEDTCDIRPLAEIIDPDSLDGLFSPRQNGQRRPGGELSFIYSGCRVTVQNGEYISVRPLGSGDGTTRTDRAN